MVSDENIFKIAFSNYMTYLSKTREPFQQLLDDPLIIIPMKLYQIRACVFQTKYLFLQ